MGGWSSARAKLLLTAPSLLVLIVVVLIALRLSSDAPVGRASRLGSARADTALPAYRPLRVTPPQTAIERTVDQGFAQEWSGESASTAAMLPGAATSVGLSANRRVRCASSVDVRAGLHPRTSRRQLRHVNEKGTPRLGESTTTLQTASLPSPL